MIKDTAKIPKELTDIAKMPQKITDSASDICIYKFLATESGGLIITENNELIDVTY